MRPTTDHERGRLKAATRAAVIAAGTAKQLAACTRIGEPQISRCQGDYPDFLPLDVVLDCERLAGAPVITAALADLLGFRLVPVDAGEPDSELTEEHGMDAVLAATEALATIRDARRDGRWDAAERRDALNKLNAILQVVQEAIRAHAGKG